jgi:aspartate aminotransferase-like enzyme
MKFRHKVLMIPGPSESSDSVLNTMCLPTPAHYMDDWVERYNDVTKGLKSFFGTKNNPFIITGSGSSGLEAAAATAIEPGDKVLADSTGDDVFAPFISAHGAKLIPLEIPPGTGADPDNIRSILEKEKNVKAIATCHNITATSATNPIDEIGGIAAEYGCLFLVDVISSIGGMKVEMDKWNIDICCAATQKAFSVPPGLAMVAVSPKAWSVAERRKTRIESEYLNLVRYKEAASPPQNEWHPTPDTCATTLVRALQQSIHDILDEGLERVFHRHAVVAEAVREGFKGMGLELLVQDPKRYSNTVTAAKWPKGGDYTRFWRTMFDEFNIMLGNPPRADPRTATGWFRMGHMGNTARSEFVLPSLGYMERAMRKAGLRVELGNGTSAAQRILAKLD